MKIHRFILSFAISDGRVEISDTEIVNQIRNVLKLKIGEQVLLCDGNMNEAVGQIEELRKDSVMVEIVKEQKNENEAGRNVILYCAVLKRENFELVVQKATEVGVKEIVPLITRRTVKLNLRHDRLEKIIKEAAEQSGRGMAPVLREPMDFTMAVEHAKANDVNWFFDGSGGAPMAIGAPQKRIGVFVGPEGGFDESEIVVAKAAGFAVATLGKLTLRGETAAIIASYLAAN